MKLLRSVRNRIRKTYYRLSFSFWDRYDRRKDLRLFGVSLTEYVPSVFRHDDEEIGYIGTESSRYFVLDRLFEHVSFSENDRFLDVGCGKGRVLGYLALKYPALSLTGAEINPCVAEFAEKWTQRFPNVEILSQNVFDVNLDAFTVLFLFRPFLKKTALAFWEKAERELTHPVRIVLWNDLESAKHLSKRSAFRLLTDCQMKKNKKFFIPFSHKYNRLYILEYDPAQKN